MPTNQEILDKANAGEALSESEQHQIMEIPHAELENVDDSEAAKLEDEAQQAAAESEKAGEKPDDKPEEKPAEGEAKPEDKPDDKPADSKPEKTGDADTPEAKKDQKGDDKPADTGEAETIKPEGAGDQKRVDAELAKPAGQENLTGFSSEQRGLFYNLRHERSLRQAAEAERDTLKFNKLKKEKEEAGEEEPEEGDFLNKGQVQKAVNQAVAGVQLQHRRQMTQVWMREGRREFKDFDVIVALGDHSKLIDNDQAHQAKIREAYEAGDNPAVVTYDLVKTDPKFKELALAAGLIEQDGVWIVKPAEGAKKDDKPEEKKPDANKAPTEDAKKGAAKAVANQDKTDTTAGAGGGGAGGGEGEITLEYARSLTDAQYAALPPAKRQKILELYG